MKISFTVSDDDAQRVIDAVASEYPIPVDPTGSPLFTDAQWAKERGRRFYMNAVRQHERRLAQATVKVDDGLIS